MRLVHRQLRKDNPRFLAVAQLLHGHLLLFGSTTVPAKPRSSHLQLRENFRVQGVDPLQRILFQIKYIFEVLRELGHPQMGVRSHRPGSGL